jgi:hypothetical protein
MWEIFVPTCARIAIGIAKSLSWGTGWNRYHDVALFWTVKQVELGPDYHGQCFHANDHQCVSRNECWGKASEEGKSSRHQGNFVRSYLLLAWGMNKSGFVKKLKVSQLWACNAFHNMMLPNNGKVCHILTAIIQQPMYTFTFLLGPVRRSYRRTWM